MARNGSPSWTETEDATVASMRRLNASAVEIKAMLPGRALRSVENRISYLIRIGALERQNARHTRNRALDPLLKRTVQSGLDIETLCEIFRCSDTTLYHWPAVLGCSVGMTSRRSS